jgi:hypothetical protein
MVGVGSSSLKSSRDLSKKDNKDVNTAAFNQVFTSLLVYHCCAFSLALSLSLLTW